MAGQCWMLPSTLRGPAIGKSHLSSVYPRVFFRELAPKEGACLCVKLAVLHPLEKRLDRWQPPVPGLLSARVNVVSVVVRPCDRRDVGSRQPPAAFQLISQGGLHSLALSRRAQKVWGSMDPGSHTESLISLNLELEHQGILEALQAG